MTMSLPSGEFAMYFDDVILLSIETSERIFRERSDNIWYVITLPCFDVAQNLVYFCRLAHGNVIDVSCVMLLFILFSSYLLFLI